jgi:hypothetical protein
MATPNVSKFIMALYRLGVAREVVKCEEKTVLSTTECLYSS